MAGRKPLVFVETPENEEAVNPFKNIRRRKGLSQQVVSELIGVSRQAIIRLEQGMFPDPLPTVTNWYVEHWGINRGALIREYSRFQEQVRENNYRILGEVRIDLVNWCYAQGHPVGRIIKGAGLNPTSFAKALCINQKVVAHFLKNTVSQQTVPKQIVEALQENGYTELETVYLEEIYKDYRKRFLKEREDARMNMHSRPEPKKVLASAS